MEIKRKFRDEKLQYDINKKAAKISELSSSKIDKYKYLTDKEILPSDQSAIVKQSRFTYYPFGKTLENKQKRLKTKGKNN